MSKIYPIEIQNFEKIRRDGYFYIDKTALVYQNHLNPAPMLCTKKRETLYKELNDYKITFKVFSLEDM